MNTTGDSSLSEQRTQLRRQLQAQRRQMEAQLGHTRSSAIDPAFPRSVTMRLLLDQPSLLMRFVSLILGARLAGSLRTVIGLIQVFHAGWSRTRHPAIAAPRDPR